MQQPTLKDIETAARRAGIRAALDKYDGNRTLAAEALGVSRSQLYRYLAELGLDDVYQPNPAWPPGPRRRR
jgi:DNA-binding NtrC family response regulator